MVRFYLSINQVITSSRVSVFALEIREVKPQAQKSAATGDTVNRQHFFQITM